jgi:hypothetical protein
MGVAVIRSRPKPGDACAPREDRAAERQRAASASSVGERSVTVGLEGFAWEALAEESARLGVPVHELVAYAVSYYLADVDSGRVARRVSRGGAHNYPDSDASI